MNQLILQIGQTALIWLASQGLVLGALIEAPRFCDQPHNEFRRETSLDADGGVESLDRNGCYDIRQCYDLWYWPCFELMHGMPEENAQPHSFRNRVAGYSQNG